MALSNSVGRGGINDRDDVRQVQTLLQSIGLYQGPIDGICGSRTVAAIIDFQKPFLTDPDGRVDRGGLTWRRLHEAKAEPSLEPQADNSLLLTQADYKEAARQLGCEVAAIKAVAEVESAGAGFLKDGRPRILFEGHKFHEQTKGLYSQSHPSLSHPKWTKEFYSKGTPEQQGQGELTRLEQARKLNPRAALLSCSVGKFQIMGFNYKYCGYASVEEFWEQIVSHEREQLRAFCAFIKNKQLVQKLIDHDWEAFAKAYNGKEYKKNNYDTKIAKAYERFSNEARKSTSA